MKFEPCVFAIIALPMLTGAGYLIGVADGKRQQALKTDEAVVVCSQSDDYYLSKPEGNP